MSDSRKSPSKIPEIKDATKIRAMSPGRVMGLFQAVQEMRPLEGRPPVEICIAVYNTNAAHLKACMHSLKRQNYPNIRRIIIVDDGSTDPSTIAAMKKIEAEAETRRLAKTEPYIDVLWMKHRGAGAAYNTLFENVSKDIDWAFLVGSDDMINYETVNAVMFCAQPEIMGIGTFCIIIDDDGQPIRKWPVMGAPAYNMRIFREMDIWFDETLAKWIDEEHFGRVRKALGKDDCFRVVREFLYYYRFHGDNITGRAKELELLKKGKSAMDTLRKTAAISLTHQQTAQLFAKEMKANYVTPDNELLDYKAVYLIGFNDPGLAGLLPQLKAADLRIMIHFFPEDIDVLDYSDDISKRIKANADICFAQDKKVKAALAAKGIDSHLLNLNLLNNPDQVLIFQQRFGYLAFGIRQKMAMEAGQ